MAYITFQPSDYFNTKLYTGTGSSNAQTGVGFQPDWLWIKDRDSGSNSHIITDAIRGTNKIIFTDSNGVELTDANRVTSFNSDGFTVGTDGSTNTNTNDYVSWNWKANGQGSSNTDGTINTTYTSASTTSGFSICQWTGSGANATIGHGLGVVPKMIMVKNLATTDSWNVYHESMGNNKRVFLDTTGDQSTTSDAWNSTSPTTSVFSVGTNTGTNKSGDALIAYCFAEIKGFSRIGFYTGNGSVSGPFVYTGFKPAFVLFKEYTGAGDANWVIQDSKRVGFNPNNNRIYPNDAAAENTSSFRIDMLSNGFKLTSNDGDANQSGNDFLYMAFAEHPFVSSNNVPVTAR
jgi:hypothetical protein